MKKIIALMVIFMMAFTMYGQRYYFFCLNLSDHTDGAYVSGVIDSVLNKMDKTDEFLIYIRGGVNSEGKVFDAAKITDGEAWKEARDLLDYIDRCGVSLAELDMLRKTIQPQYEVTNRSLQPGKSIVVYWFGDEIYYRDYGKSLFLPFYYAVDGERTWEACFLYGDNKENKTQTPQERLGVSEYPLDNVYIK